MLVLAKRKIPGQWTIYQLTTDPGNDDNIEGDIQFFDKKIVYLFVMSISTVKH